VLVLSSCSSSASAERPRRGAESESILCVGELACCSDKRVVCVCMSAKKETTAKNFLPAARREGGGSNAGNRRDTETRGGSLFSAARDR